MPLRSYLPALLLLAARTVWGAALVPLPSPNVGLPLAGIEANQGQVRAEVLFLTRGAFQAAVSAQSISFAPVGVTQVFVAGNPNPSVRYSDPLPGVANSFTGSDAGKWVRGVRRYATARLVDVYPGIDVEYHLGTGGQLTMRLFLRAGADLSKFVFDVPEALSPSISDGSLRFRIGPTKFDPTFGYAAPVAFFDSGSGADVRFEIQSPTRFGLRAEGSTLPARIDIAIGGAGNSAAPQIHPITDTNGNFFAVVPISDTAGKDAPFADVPPGACRIFIGSRIACTDVAIYKLTPAGDLIWVSYLAGRTNEAATFLGMGANGNLVVTGGTNSDDFPVTATGFQSKYAGPPARTTDSSSSPGPAGDFFAVILDAASGDLKASTYLGGPNADSVGQTALGQDGSVYFMPVWLGSSSAGMPVSPGALQSTCAEPCYNGYAGHLDAGLGKLLFGTYLPGFPQATAKLQSDGSIYYAGSAGAGFPTTPGAYQPQLSGETDAIVARLDPTGSRLVFATYIGGPLNDWIARMTPSPDGSVWVAVTSFAECCVDVTYRLVHLDAQGAKVLADLPIVVDDLATDRNGNVIALAFGNIDTSPDAFLRNSCAQGGYSYIRLSPSGTLLFGTYLPGNLSNGFDGISARGLPILKLRTERAEIVEGQSMGTYAGCMVDGAAFADPEVTSPGEIVTLFGSKLGPRTGVAFQLADGRVPVKLGGTRVLVNGAPVPILFASESQVNAILPYSLKPGVPLRIQVEVDGIAGNTLDYVSVLPAVVSLFRTEGIVTIGGAPFGRAAALNEDGTVNSPANPAKAGSRIVLFGTGGGVTSPQSEAGEVTPAEIRRLASGVSAWISFEGKQFPLVVEYAGAAPTLVAGVSQINLKLPDVFPQIAGVPAGVLPIAVQAPGSSYSGGLVAISVAP
ncbi:MAG: hypothetical protein ABI823_02305 [Bryobacteraceae bacterium]